MGSIYRLCKSNLKERMRKNRRDNQANHQGGQQTVNSHCQPWPGVHFFKAFLQLWLITIFVLLSGPLIFMTGHVCHRTVCCTVTTCPNMTEQSCLRLSPVATEKALRLAPCQGTLWVSGKRWRQKSSRWSWSLLAWSESDGKLGTPQSASAEPVSGGNDKQTISPRTQGVWPHWH